MLDPGLEDADKNARPAEVLPSHLSRARLGAFLMIVAVVLVAGCDASTPKAAPPPESTPPTTAAPTTAVAPSSTALATTTSTTEATEAIATLAVAPASATLTVGETQAFTVTLVGASPDAAGGRAAWTSAAPAVATVSGTGVVSALQAGTATITVTADGASATAAVTVIDDSAAEEMTSAYVATRDYNASSLRAIEPDLESSDLRIYCAEAADIDAQFLADLTAGHWPAPTQPAVDALIIAVGTKQVIEQSCSEQPDSAAAIAIWNAQSTIDAHLAAASALIATNAAFNVPPSI